MSKDKNNEVLFKCPFCKADFLQRYIEEFDVYQLYTEDIIQVDCIECDKEINVSVSCTEFKYDTDDLNDDEDEDDEQG